MANGPASSFPARRVRRRLRCGDRSGRAPILRGSALSRLMRVRWTTDAADDLERICDYLAEDRPESARRGRSPWSSASGRWRRFRTSGALVAFRHARDRVSSPPVRRHLRSSRGTDRRLANPPRSAALAERALIIIMLPRIAITRAWSDNDVAQLTFEVCDGMSVFTNAASPFGRVVPTREILAHHQSL